MVLPNPASPATTMPETSASRIMTGVLSSAQPSHQEVRESGAMPERSILAGARSGSRCSPRSWIRPWALLLGPDADTAPGVGQVASGPLIVSQTSASDGRHRGGHALVVSDELGRWEAVLAGPLIPIAKPQGLRQQRPLRRQPPGLAGSLTDGGLLGMAAGLSEREAAGRAGTPARVAVPPTKASSSDRPTRVASICATSLIGSRGVGGGGRSAARHSSARPARHRRRRPGRAGSSGRASRSHTPDSQGRPARPGWGWGQ